MGSEGEGGDLKVRAANRRTGNRFNIGNSTSGKGSGQARSTLGAAGSQIVGSGPDILDESMKRQSKTSALADLFSTAANESTDPFGFSALHETVASDTSQDARKKRKHRRRVKAAGGSMEDETED